MNAETVKELKDVWGALSFVMECAIELKKRSVDFEERIRHLEGDPCEPPATAEDFDLPEEEA